MTSTCPMLSGSQRMIVLRKPRKVGPTAWHRAEGAGESNGHAHGREPPSPPTAALSDSSLPRVVGRVVETVGPWEGDGLQVGCSWAHHSRSSPRTSGRSRRLSEQSAPVCYPHSGPVM